MSTIHHKIAHETNEYSFILVTILKMSAVFAGPLKQNQRLASRPQADAAVKSLCKGGSWASRELRSAKAQEKHKKHRKISADVRNLHRSGRTPRDRERK
jgi:hypoxanthine-guanine phosphoribosyltransferase